MQKEEFSVAQWVWKIALVAVLTVIIASFYVKQFEISDALPYFGALLFIGGVSIWITKYHDSHNDPFKVAAFACSVGLILLMCANAAICFGTGRDMTVAKQETDGANERITACEERIQTMLENSRLGPVARANLTKQLGNCRKGTEKIKTRQQIYGEADSLLYWIMVAEFLSAAIVAMLMTGLHSFRKPVNIANNEIRREDLNAEIEVRRELAAANRQQRIAQIRSQTPAPPLMDASEVKRGTQINGWEAVRDDRMSHGPFEFNKWEYVGQKPGVLASGHVGAARGGGPDVDPSSLAIGTRATGDDGDKWIVRDTGNGREWVRDTASPSLTANQNTAQLRQNETRGHFRYDAPSLPLIPVRDQIKANNPDDPDGAVKLAETPSLSNRVATRVATQNSKVATQTPLEVLREALREVKKEGHFFFQADKKRNHILVRQMSSEGGVADAIASHTMDLEFLEFAQQVIDGRSAFADFVKVVREELLSAGFDLEGGTR